MGQRCGAADHGIGFAAEQCAEIRAGQAVGADRAIARVQIALTAETGIEFDHLAFHRVPTQQAVDVLVAHALAPGRWHCGSVAGEAAIEIQRIRIGLVEVAVETERERVGQRAAELEAGTLATAFGTVLRHKTEHRHRAGQIAGRLLGDDVDHATGGTRAIACSGRAAQHFDALHRLGRHPVGVATRIALAAAAHAHRIARSHRLAIDQNQRVFRAHTAQIDLAVVAVLARGTVAGEIDARHGAQQLRQIVDRWAPFDVFGGDHR